MKKSGFSLAEMMIVMLMVAIVLAATTPMITRKITRERDDKVFDILATDPMNAVEYIKGRNQRLFMNAKNGGYVGITEEGGKIPENTVLFGYNKFKESNSTSTGSNSPLSPGFNPAELLNQKAKQAVGIGFNTNNGGPRTTAIGYSANASAMNTTAIGAKTEAKYPNSTAIGFGAKTEHPYTIVLGTENDTVYIPGNLVVNHAALVGLANSKTDNLYIKPIDADYFATFSARGYSGDDNNLLIVHDCNKNKYTLNSKVGPYETIEHPASRLTKLTITFGRDTAICYPDLTAIGSDDNKGGKSSDIRLKNLEEPFIGGIEELNKLPIYNYKFKKDKTPQVGVIAQDLQKVFPNAVTKDKKGYLSIRWDEMFYATINAVKELNTKISTVINDIADIKSTIKQQEEEIKDLEDRIEKLEKLIDKE